MKKPLLKFYEAGKDHRGKQVYYVYNHVEEFLGVINMSRVGKFLHWIFCPQETTFYTNGCLKEIVEFITSLYKSNKKRSKKHGMDRCEKKV
jgi:hypothetical protein